MKYMMCFLILCACRGPAGVNGSDGENGQIGPQGPQGIQGQNGTTPSQECAVTIAADGVLISCKNGTLIHVSNNGCY